MTELKQQELHDTAHVVGAMIAACFLQAARSDDVDLHALARLVVLADRLSTHQDQLALHMVIGALARMEFTYPVPRVCHSDK